jgi:hypothetical protein
MDAIVLCDELEISFPSSDTDLQAAADGFKSVSSHGVIDGCVGCLDGILLKIQTPASKDVGNVKSFFSGHYQTYGINVQAACDHQCRLQVYVLLPLVAQMILWPFERLHYMPLSIHCQLENT